VWTGIRRLAAWLADHEIWWLVPTVPLLVFPGRWNVAGLALLPIPWLCRWLGRGRLTRPTWLEWALLSLLLMVPVTLWATALPEVTRLAVYQLLAGMAVFYSLVNWTSSESRLWWATLGLVALGLALALIAPVGVRWSTGKLFALSRLYSRFPLLLKDSINPNVLAGALVVIMPMALSLALPGGERRRCLLRVAMGLSFLLMLFILVLTQSRGAYIAIAFSLLSIAILHNRWFLLSLPLGLAGLAVAWWRLGTQPLVDLLVTTQTIGGWEGRREVWSRAIYMVQDFPYTGIGMGTFNQVANLLYPFFLAGPDAEIPHAHNLFLQIGVDLGLPGLVAYLALLTACFLMAWRAYTWEKSQIPNPKSEIRNPKSQIAIGLLGSLTALVVHGLMDAVTWGTKPSVVTWAVFGVTMALYRLAGERAGGMRGRGAREPAAPSSGLRPSAPVRRGSSGTSALFKNLSAFAYWILFSLLAIAFIGNRPYVGLAIALAGGAILGFFSVMSFAWSPCKELVA